MNKAEEIKNLLHLITVKITTKSKSNAPENSEVFGTGVIYPTENSQYAYIFTALHNILGKRIRVEKNNQYANTVEDIKSIEIIHDIDDERLNYTIHKESELKSNIIQITHQDFAIILIDKTHESHTSFINHIKAIPFYYILKKEKPSLKKIVALGYPAFYEGKAWSTQGKSVKDGKIKGHYTIKLEDNIDTIESDKIGGFSGSGVFYEKKDLLIGLVTKLPNKENPTNRIIVNSLHNININEYLKANTYDLDEVSIRQSTAYDGDIDYLNINIKGVFYNLVKAIRRVKNDMKDDWFQDPLMFEDILNYRFIYSKLKNQHNRKWGYKPSKSLLFSIPKKGYSARYAMKTNIVDRVVYQMLIDYLISSFDDVVENSVYSFRFNTTNSDVIFINPVEQWKKMSYQLKCRVKKRAKKEDVHLLIADIAHFYDSINIDKLIEILHKCNDVYITHEDKDKQLKYRQTINTLEELLKAWCINNSSVGIPQNRDTSQFLANLYLVEVDKTMINKGYEYYRYADDIRIICKNKLEAQTALKDFITELRGIRLNVNASKTIILSYKNNKSQIEKYFPSSDLKLEQIASLLNAKKSRDVQIAIFMLRDLFEETKAKLETFGDIFNNNLIGEISQLRSYLQKEEESENSYLIKPLVIQMLEKIEKKDTDYNFDLVNRHLKFVIKRFSQFAREPYSRNVLGITFLNKIAIFCINNLEKTPWHSDMYIHFLKSLPKEYFSDEFHRLSSLITGEYSLYEWQIYQLWLLFAHHKIHLKNLVEYAYKEVDNPNSDNKPNTAGAIIYLAVVEGAYAISLIKKGLDNNKYNDFFTQRSAIIATQKFPCKDFKNVNIEKCLQGTHQHLHNRSKVHYIKPLKELDIKTLMRDVVDSIASLT